MYSSKPVSRRGRRRGRRPAVEVRERVTRAAAPQARRLAAPRPGLGTYVKIKSLGWVTM